jgi:hypothetical protein
MDTIYPEICSLDARQFARGEKMTLDVIYPSREFVLMLVRHSRIFPFPFLSRLPISVLRNRPPRLSSVLAERIIQRIFTFPPLLLSSPRVGCSGRVVAFRVFVWYDIEIDDGGYRAMAEARSVYFTLEFSDK